MIVVMRSFILLLLMSLTSCSYFSTASVMNSQDKNYLSARSIPPLRIPPGISTTSFESDYPVSDRSYPVNQLQVNLTPPGLQQS